LARISLKLAWKLSFRLATNVDPNVMVLGEISTIFLLPTDLVIVDPTCYLPWFPRSSGSCF
jgi:hypothetical protein